MIKVTDKYYIEIDNACYTVYERKIAQSGKNSGKELFQNPTYYGNLHMALDNIIRRMTVDELKSKDVIELQDAVTAIEKLKEKVIEIAFDLMHVEGDLNEISQH